MEQLYYHGNIITMENPEDCPESVLVRDGIIAAVGDFEELKQQAGDECEMRDLQGRTLMPAFIDTHGHASLTTMYIAMADLSSANSFADIIELLRKFRQEKNLTNGETIFGYGYDHNFLKEEAHPTKSVLDQVSTENPIVIWHTSVHMAVANTAALALVGINADTPEPEGGVIGREADGKEPNGYLEETAAAAVRQLQKEMPLDLIPQIKEAQMTYVRQGITTIQDGAAEAIGVNMCRMLAGQDQLFIDMVAYPTIKLGPELTQLMEKNQDCINHYVNHYKIGGYKIVLDGSPQGKSAWMTKPYENSGDYCGYPWLQDEVVEQEIKLALDDNLQVLVHCNGDAAGDQYLNAYEKMLAQSDNPNKNNLRSVMIHCQTAREDQLDRMAKMKIIPSIFVAHVNYWGDIHLKNFGQERGSRVSPVKSALDRGLVYNFHTDTPVVQPDIFHTIWSAVNRITRKGVLCGPEQCIGVYDALKGVTINGAYAYFEEDSKGSIKPGKRADLIIVSDNPLTIDPMELRDIVVIETIKDGKTIYQQ